METRIISEVEANQLHAEMQRLGFWDTTSPFPKVKTKRQASANRRWNESRQEHRGESAHRSPFGRLCIGGHEVVD